MTKWSFEVPIPHLKDFHEDQDFIFTLNHLYSAQANPLAKEYRAYVDKCNASGLIPIWLDNSYNELMKADTTQELGYTAKTIRASKVIAPDDPKWSTDQIAKKYEELHSEGISNDRIILVTSSIEMYDTLRQLKQVSTYAVSYWTRDSWLYDDLLKIRSLSNLHYLGFLNPEEITAVYPQSCDTSMPIKLALKNITFEQWCVEGCYHINTKDLGLRGMEYFSREMTYAEIELAKYNIKRLKEVCA